MIKSVFGDSDIPQLYHVILKYLVLPIPTQVELAHIQKIKQSSNFNVSIEMIKFGFNCCNNTVVLLSSV